MHNRKRRFSAASAGALSGNAGQSPTDSPNEAHSAAVAGAPHSREIASSTAANTSG